MSEHVSARIDDDIARLLDEPGRNKSETINEALNQYFDAQGGKKTIAKMRLDQVNDEITELESRLEVKYERKQHLQEVLEQQETEQEKEEQELWNQALSLLSFEENIVDNGVRITSKDEAIEDFADDLGMDVEAFKDELKTRYKQR